MNQETLDLLTQLERLGLNDERFKQVHHFSQPQFKAAPSTIDQHRRWCTGREFQPDPNENRQTCRRLRALLSQLEAGEDWPTAIEQAWKEFGLVTR